MEFKPGNKFSKGRGRPRGSKNKRGTIQERVTRFLQDNFDDLQHEWDYEMSPGQKIKAYEILLPFATPKLQDSRISIFDTLPDEQLELMVAKLREGITDDPDAIKIEANDPERKASQYPALRASQAEETD